MYIWDYIKETSLPIVIYGTGDGGDKMLDALAKHDKECFGFIVSDEFYRGQIFKGYTCYTRNQIDDLLPDYLCLIAFGSRLENVIDKIIDISKHHKVLMPSLPLFSDTIFDCDYYNVHKTEMSKAKELLNDDISKETFDKIIEYRLSGDIETILSVAVKDETFDFLKNETFDSYIDLGAYRGDTLKEALDLFEINDFICFEPADHPYKKLCEFVKNTCVNAQAHLYKMAAYDNIACISFSDGGGKGSHINEKTFSSLSGAKEKQIQATALDFVCDYSGKKLLIKYDVEGEEEKALDGSMKTIQNNDTTLVISLYHKPEDIFSLPLKLKQQFPNCTMHLRKLYGIPDWDILLYVKINNQTF